MSTDGIIYIPQYDTYRIKVGKRTVEIEAQTFKRICDINMIEDILRSNNGNLKNNLFNAILEVGGRLVSNSWDNASTHGNDYVNDYDPIDALYRGMPDPTDTVVACMDLPKPTPPTPDFDPSAAPKVYFNERFPSKRSGDIIDEAIKLLNTKKDLHMTKMLTDQVFEGFKLSLHSDMPAARGMGKTLIVLIKHAAFDRAHRSDIDDEARLMAKLDTNTYIKLRIAFLLYEALKTCEYNRHQMDSDIFEILYSN